MNDSIQELACEFNNDFGANSNAQGPSVLGNNDKSSTKGILIHSILVNPKQRGNPILKSIRNVPWEFDEIVPDYQMGRTTCALFLSLRYHNLHPDYIHERLKLLGKSYELRVLLVQVDVKDPHHLLKNLTRICILADMTLILAWSAEEAGQILETYKVYEHKPANAIMEKAESSPYLHLIQLVSSIRLINKTDAMTLLERFKTLKGIIKATEKQLSECPGIGAKKAHKLYTALHEQFWVRMKRNHVPCDIFEELLQGTCLEPYTLVPYKSSTNLDDPFVDEMEITCTSDKTASSMNVCLEHYTNGSARDHQISVHNKRTNLDDLFVDEMEIVCTCAQATSSKRVCLEHYADRPASEQQITVEIPDTPPPSIFDSRDPMSVTIARVSKLISSDSTS
ncbi:hypothetical protein FQA39_LY07520 [Lamprigera yunnana]|nr:hypothetical protein FQA39_LY07520 [Lamprigera yunnana]